MEKFIKKLLSRDKLLVFLFFVLLSLFCFRKVIFSPGTVGHLLDWPFPSQVKELQTYFNEAFYAWHSHSLGSAQVFMVVSLWAGFWGFFGHLGLSGEWVSKFCLLSLIPLAGFSMYLLLNELFPSSSKEKKINLPAFFGSLFYAVSPVMINQVLGGAVLFLISYGLSPLGFLFFIKGVDEKGINWSRGIFLAFLWAIAGIDNHFLIFWAILFLFYILFTKEKKILYLKLFGFVVFLVLILHSFWLVGFFLNYRSNSTTFLTTGTNEFYLDNLIAHSGPLASVITLIANFNPNLFKEVMSLHLAKIWFLASLTLLIAIFSFSILSLRKKIVLYALCIVLVGIFFSKGIYTPFGGINLWLYRNFVPMNMFRTLHHIQFLVVFGYSLLVGNLFDYLRLKQGKISLVKPTLFFIFLMLIYIHPLLSGNINNGVFTFQEPKDLTIIKGIMDNLDGKPNNGGGYRILFFPTSGSVGYKDQRIDLSGGGSFSTVLYSPRPTLDSIIGSELGTKFAQYLERNVYLGGFSQNIDRVLALANIKYLIPRDDLVYLHLPFGKSFWEQKGAYQKLIDFLGKQKELNRVISYFDMSLWENKNFLPHFYIPQNIIYSNDNIESLSDIASFGDWKIRSAIYLKPETSRGNGEVFLEGENKDIEDFMLDIKNKENFKNNLQFPYVKYKPPSFIYFLVLKKGQFEEWRVRKDQEKLIDKKLFFASKRMSEFEKFADENIDKLTDSSIKNYEKKMDEVIEEIGRLRDLKLKENMMIKLMAYWERHKEKIGEILDKEKERYNLQGEMGYIDVSKNWEEVFNRLYKKIILPESMIDFRNFEYSLEIPKGGNYLLMIKDLNGLTDYKVEIDGEILDQNGFKIREDGWINLSEKNLKEGEHILAFRLSEPKNLVGDNWQEMKGLEIGKKEITFYSQGFPPQQLNDLFQPIKDWSIDNFYYLTFDYKIESGNLDVGVLEEKAEYQNGEKIVKTEQSFGKTLSSNGIDNPEDWKKFETILQPNPEASGAKINFRSNSDSHGATKLGFRNLKVYKIIQPTVALRSVEPRSSNFNLQTPRITFVKFNPTKYKVRVEGAKVPYSLIFSESFNKGWKLYLNDQPLATNNQQYREIIASYFNDEIKESPPKNIFLDKSTFETWNKKSLPEDRHLLVNGYANSWYITPEDVGGKENYELIVEFWPQRLFYFGLGISGLTLLGCLGCLGYKFARKRN